MSNQAGPSSRPASAPTSLLQTSTADAPSSSRTAQNAEPEPARPSKLAKNKRLPATMITPSGAIASSKKAHAKDKQVSRKQKARAEKGRERAVELAGKLEEKVKGREERKAKRNRAKNAWE